MHVGCCVNDPSKFEEITSHVESMGFSPTAQVFLREPSAFKDVHTADQLEQLGIWGKKHPLLVHSAFVSYPWSGAKSSLFNMGLEAALCRQVNATGYIIHLAPSTKDIRLLTAVLSRLAHSPFVVFFEINSAKPSAQSYHTPELLRDVFELICDVASKHDVSVGLCVDTAHLFAAGVSFAEYDVARDWLKQTADLLREVPICFHLNDSYEVQGSGRDKHAGLTKGNIWKEDQGGIKAVMEFAAEHHTLVILEQAWDVARAGLELLAVNQ